MPIDDNKIKAANRLVKIMAYIQHESHGQGKNMAYVQHESHGQGTDNYVGANTTIIHTVQVCIIVVFALSCCIFPNLQTKSGDWEIRD